MAATPGIRNLGKVDLAGCIYSNINITMMLIRHARESEE
jgi:hypothetical protein